MLRWHNITDAYPNISNMLSGGIILSISDYTAQYITSYNEFNYKWDKSRTLALGTFGCIYFGFIARNVYFIWDKLFGFGPKSGLYKSFMDCTVHTFLGYIPGFYIITGIMKGQSINNIYTQMENEYFQACIGTTIYWSIPMYILFQFCSHHWRVIYISMLSFIHKTVLSMYSNRERMRNRLVRHRLSDIDKAPT